MKRRLFALILGSLFLFTGRGVQADEVKRFETVNPTVKITSYKKLFIGDVMPFASGSGTVINNKGLILTNYHVIFDEEAKLPLDAFAICMTFNAKEEPVCEYTAQLIAHDEDRDIALLQLNSRDVFNNPLPPSLPFLGIPDAAKTDEQSLVRIIGYPASGGETITTTQGQISGFETLNGFKYFKTDTDFDHGSSGGTVLDGEGRFMGIPTYIRTYTENVGYFLDIHEAVPWLNLHMRDLPPQNTPADDWIKTQLKEIADVNKKRVYRHGIYPYFSFNLPTGWKLASAAKDNLLMYKKDSKDNLSFNVDLSFYQFAIDPFYLDRLHLDLDRLKKNYPDYVRTTGSLGGKTADIVSYTTLNQHHFDYYVPYGYTMLHAHYALDLDKKSSEQAEIQSILSSFKFSNEPVQEPALPSRIVFDEPAFNIESKGNWRFQKHVGAQPQGLIVEAVEKNNFDGYMYVSYLEMDQSNRALSAKERLAQAIKAREGNNFTLVYKKDDVVLDGRTGWLLTFEYEGQRYQEIRQRLEIHLDYGAYELVFTYDDLADHFQNNLETLRSILRSFKNTSLPADAPAQGVYQFGALTYPFDDIRYHRYAGAITDLVDKRVIKKQGAHFFPERAVTRMQAVTLVIDSKNNLEQERGGAAIALGLPPAERKHCQDRFSDLKQGSSLKYVCTALNQHFLNGYPDHTFRPQNSITLAEALKLILTTYHIPVWKDQDLDPMNAVAWYKAYMDKGFELELIPYGLYNPAQRLSKGELAYLIHMIYNQAR